MNLTELYQKDAHAWYFANAKMLREKRFEEIDLDNLIEEVESMGRSEQSKLESYLTELFLHLLKWKYQREKSYGASWEISIAKQRNNAKEHLKEYPSLKGHLDKILKKAYKNSKFDAAKETNLNLKIFPEEMPFTLDEALQEDWFPDYFPERKE
jgi:hypothetical protein